MIRLISAPNETLFISLSPALEVALTTFSISEYDLSGHFAPTGETQEQTTVPG
jgi:hypothetical protein